jgi:hypothetical protein
VCKEELIAWWNALDERFDECEQQRLDREATLAASYAHGRDATVLPDMAGHVRSSPKA